MPERQEAAELLLASNGAIDELDDAALLNAWAGKSNSVQDFDVGDKSVSVTELDVLAPAALAVLNAAAAMVPDGDPCTRNRVHDSQRSAHGELTCPHGDGHPLPLGMARVALESTLFP